jgi:hypothetical protein
MIVMMIAITPSLNASIRPFVTGWRVAGWQVGGSTCQPVDPPT